MDTFISIVTFGSLGALAFALAADLISEPAVYKFETLAFIAILFLALAAGAHLS